MRQALLAPRRLEVDGCLHVQADIPCLADFENASTILFLTASSE